MPANSRGPGTVLIRCKQTGFQARVPAATWQAWTPEQRDSYEVLDDAATAEKGATGHAEVGE